MSALIVAPTEPKLLKAIATKVSLLPEKYGVDILFPSKAGMVGIQRKEFPGDFGASRDDGRLAKESAQSQALAVRILLLEGEGVWSTDGKLMARYGAEWNKSSHLAYLLSMRQRGWWIMTSTSLSDTIATVRVVESWAHKANHSSTHVRGPMTDARLKALWGKASSTDFSRWILQGFDGVGPDIASRIVKHFNGLPLRWTASPKEMLSVPGVGKKTVERLFGALGQDMVEPDAVE